MAKLEELAREIESIHDRTEELAPIAAHVRDDSYDRGLLTQELLDARLGFFAHKLETGYYDQNAEGYARHMAQLSADAQTAEIAKEALKDESASVESTVIETPVQTNDVPAAEQASGDVEQEDTVEEQPEQTEEAQTPEQPAQPQSPPGMTTSDTLMFAPDAPGEPEVTPENATPNIEEPSKTEQAAEPTEQFTLTLSFSNAQEREAALNKLRDESYNVS